MSNTIESAVQAASTEFWKHSTGDLGHLQRARKITSTTQTILANDESVGKMNAYALITDEIARNAPAHSKKDFGKSTVAQYAASFALMAEYEKFPLTNDNADLYAMVHRAYAASVGVKNIRFIMEQSASKDEALAGLADVKRGDNLTGDNPSPDGDEDGDKKGGGGSGIRLATAIRYLSQIMEKEWSDSDAESLFPLVVELGVKFAPSDGGDGE